MRNSRANYLNSIKRDYVKLKWAETNGFQFIEVDEDEVPCLSRKFFEEKFGVDIV